MFTKLFLLALICFGQNILMSEPRRTGERFRYLPEYVNITISAGTVVDPDRDFGGWKVNDIMKLFKGFRFNQITCGPEGTGVVTNWTTGTYSGMIGCVQAGTTDTSAMAIRTDSTPFEPGIFVTFGAFSDAPKIFTFNPIEKLQYDVDILYLWCNFDDYFWIYIAITFLLSLVVSILIARILIQEFSSLECIKCIKDHFWEYFTLSVKQCEVKVSKYKSFLFLSMGTSLAILYGYHNVLINTLSSDLAVPMTNRSIESIHDLLYDPKFAHVVPILVKVISIYNTLSSARSGTKEYEIFQRMKLTENVSFMKWDMSKNDPSPEEQLALNRFIESATLGNSVLIENSILINLIMKHFLCNIKPDDMSNVREVDDEISPSSLSMLVSKKASKQLLDSIPRLEYRIQTIAEMGTITGMFQSKSYGLYEWFKGQSVPLAGLVCSEKVAKTYRESMVLSWQQFELKPFERLIKLCLMNVFFSIIVLLNEIFRKKKREQRSRKVFVHPLRRSKNGRIRHTMIQKVPQP